jgi:hypothetical protein
MARRPPKLCGCELSEAELETIRADIESLDTIDEVDDQMRALIESEWPDLLAKLPLRSRPRRTPGTRPR